MNDNIFIGYPMVFKETFETTKEAEREVQEAVTYLKEHSYFSGKYINEGAYIKSYKEEIGIEGRLKWLNEFLERQKQECQDELKDFKMAVCKECVKVRFRPRGDIFDDEQSDEDYGEED